MSVPDPTQGLSYEELLALAQSSPSGLAWVTNLRPSLQGETTQQSRWSHAKHVDYLDDYLVRLATRELRRAGYLGIIIEEPPRHGKSELCSHYFPAWYLGHFNDHRVLLSSYESEFAAEWGAKVRGTLDEFGTEIFDIQVNRASRARDRWDILDHRGGMRTAGAGGTLTGRGANLGIIDDPIKNYQEAQSKTMRNNVWNWYQSTFRTRLEPDAIVLIIMTRWHEDDLVGRILQEMEADPLADQFMRVRLPMLAEPGDVLGREAGEALWPERYDEKEAVQISKSVGSSIFEAMYQQNPVPPEGNLFKRDWFDIVEPHQVPRLRRTVRRWDLAATDEKEARDPDFTAGLKVALGDDDRFYVLDLKHMQESPGIVERTVGLTAVEDGPKTYIRMAKDPGQAGKAQVTHYARRVVPAGYSLRGVRETGPKPVRADMAAGHCERREVKLVRGPWNAKFLNEVCAYPFSAHDDIVDAFGGALYDLTKGSGLVSW